MKSQILTALLITGLVASVTHAQGTAAAPTTADTSAKREAVIDKRKENQEKRIQEGVKNGQLNQAEVQKLEKKQARVQKLEDKAKADGQIDGKEFKKIEKAQNKVSRQIKHKRHNGDKEAKGNNG